MKVLVKPGTGGRCNILKINIQNHCSPGFLMRKTHPAIFYVSSLCLCNKFLAEAYCLTGDVDNRGGRFRLI